MLSLVIGIDKTQKFNGDECVYKLKQTDIILWQGTLPVLQKYTKKRKWQEERT